ncbi:hypothetical protein E4U42_006429, partial [Claviceps africana]
MDRPPDSAAQRRRQTNKANGRVGSIDMRPTLARDVHPGQSPKLAVLWLSAEADMDGLTPSSYQNFQASKTPPPPPPPPSHPATDALRREIENLLSHHHLVTPTPTPAATPAASQLR